MVDSKENDKFYLGVKGLTTVSLKETHMKLFSIYLIKETFFFLPPEIPPNPPKNMLNNSSGVISAIKKKIHITSNVFCAPTPTEIMYQVHSHPNYIQVTIQLCKEYKGPLACELY